MLSHASPSARRAPRLLCAFAQRSDDAAVSLALTQNGDGTRAALLRMREDVISAATAAPNLKSAFFVYFPFPKLLLCHFS